MTAFTITEVSSRTRDWETKDGKSKNRSYYVKCEGDDKTYELAQKRDREPPKAGDTLDAKVEPREHEGVTYYKLVREYQQGGRGGGGNRGHSPEERASIERQVAAKCATDLIVSWLPSRATESIDLDTLLVWHTKLAAGIAEGIAA